MNSWKAKFSLALLVTLSVLFCYCFEWDWLEWLTAESLIRIATVCGVGAKRLAWDVIEWQGTPIQFTTACTFVDVFFGAVAIVWSSRCRFIKNIGHVAALAVGLFCFNLLRLTVGFLLYTRGIPWVIAHDVLAGFSYFAVWVVVMPSAFRLNLPEPSRWRGTRMSTSSST